MVTAQSKLNSPCAKKRAFSTSSVDSANSQTLEQAATPQSISVPRTSTTSSTAEEIVLDSSDDEDIGRPKTINSNNKSSLENRPKSPSAKRARMRISSSDSDDDSASVQKTTSLSANLAKPLNAVKPSPTVVNVAKQSTVVNVAKPSTVVNAAKPLTVVNSTASKQVVAKTLSVTVTKPSNPVQNTATISKVTVTNSGDKDKTFSVSVKAVPTASTTQSVTSAPKSQSIPNLPKGLVITQVGNSSNSKVHDTNTDTSNSSTSSVASETANIPTYTRIVTSDSQNHKKSAQVVRIQSSNGVTAKPSDSSSSTQQSQSLSVMPKGVTLTPVAANSSSGAGSSQSASGVVPKPKSSKGKRKKDERDEEDDEEYGNDLIFDSDDSDFEEENLTSAHGAVLKYFQDSNAEELMCIPGCSKKKVDAILNVRPFQNWGDLVRDSCSFYIARVPMAYSPFGTKN